MPTQPKRKDAARNRELLLDAARRLTREKGLDITLKGVAREAGVGVGTAYRHFTGKDELVASLFAEELRAEVDRARKSIDSDDAWAALVEYLQETMRIQAENKGLRALLCPAGSDFAAVQECKGVTDPYLDEAVKRAHQQGTLRADCTADDIAFLQVALVAIMDATPNEPTAYQHHLDIFMRGMHT